MALSAIGAGAARFGPSPKAAPATITAQGIVDRIKANLGGDWRPETVDTFKAGDPATLATGVVATSMATLASSGRPSTPARTS